MRSATAPETMDIAVATKTTWKKEVGQIRVVDVAAGRDHGIGGVVRGADQAAAQRHEACEDAAGKVTFGHVTGVHQCVTGQHVHDAGDRIQAHVLRQNLCRVFGANQAGLEHREAGGHPHDQRAHDQEVKGIQGVAEFGKAAAQGSYFVHVFLRVVVLSWSLV